MTTARRSLIAPIAALLFVFAADRVGADQCIADDLIVDGSACIGFDCVCGESFGFDTLRLKENNLRIKFDDTSVAASFPRNDWQLTANDSANGGANKFSIDDISGGRTPFTVEAGARSHSLYVDDGGRIGIRTSTPAVEIHVVDGDTPTLRLEQDGSSGFTPQTWDVAGNETNFFIRDVTHGSQLPLRIRPDAPSNSVFVDTNADVGLGTASPEDALHVRRTGGDEANLRLDSSGTGAARIVLIANGNTWSNTHASNGNLVFNGSGAGNEFLLSQTGDLTLSGSINTTDCTPCVSDYVFEPEYELMPLAELERFVQTERHLPNVPSQADVDRAGRLDMTAMQMRLLEKVEELVLYTLEQQATIDTLSARLEALEGDSE